jgi:hypothetical protein
MKKFFLPVLLFVTISGIAQSSHFDKLVGQFATVYHASAKDSTKNYFGSLIDASARVLRIANPFFIDTRKDFSAAYPVMKREDLVKLLADSVIRQFVSKSFWKGSEQKLKATEEVLKLYRDKSCPCFTVEIHKTYYTGLADAIGYCETALQRDTAFMKKLTTSLIPLSGDSTLNLAAMASKYSYQNCKAINDTINSLLVNSIDDNYFADLESVRRLLFEQIMHYRKINRKDSLLRIFPGYQDYEAEIKKAEAGISGYQYATIEQKGAKDRLIMSQTFLDADYKLLGRVEYEVTPEDEPRILNFQFLSPDKISAKEREEIRSKMLKPPPINPPKQ